MIKLFLKTIFLMLPSFLLLRITNSSIQPGFRRRSSKPALSIDLSGIDYYRDSTHIELYRIDGEKKYPVAFPA